MTKYSLLVDGDPVEVSAWSRFVEREFAAYEAFWLKHVVSLTNRPEDSHFKSDEELSRIGKGHDDICIAQLHYTVLVHLVRADSLTMNPYGPLSVEDFRDAMIRLAAATDVADELLERYTHPERHYAPWSEKQGEIARKAWRAEDNSLKVVRDYRNRMIHGRQTSSITNQNGSNFVLQLGVDRHYDWREITNTDLSQLSGAEFTQLFGEDFKLAEVVFRGAWILVLNYLQTRWTQYLLS